MIPQLALYALGAGANAVQAFQSQKNMRKAQEAAQKAYQEMKAIKEINPFKQVQVPTLGSQLAQQSLDRATMGALSTLKSTGAEGAIGGVGNVLQANIGQGLENAAMLNELKFKRDATEAEIQSNIEARQAERDWMLGAQQAQSAEFRRADAEANRNASIMGIGESLTGAAGLMGDYFESNPYGSFADMFKMNKSKKTANPTSSYNWANSVPSNALSTFNNGN